MVKQCPLPCKPGLGEQRVHTPELIGPATKHILASATIKWTTDEFNLPTEDEKLGTNMFLTLLAKPAEGCFFPQSSLGIRHVAHSDANSTTVRTDLKILIPKFISFIVCFS